MKDILILEKSGADLEKEGYSKCTKAKYDDYKKDSANYYTAVSDEGKYYYKKKTAGKSEEDKKKEEKKNEPVEVDSHPKDQAEGDAFREWMKEKHPEFRCGQDTLSGDKGKPYNNSCIKDAWGKHKEDFRKRDQGSTGTGEDKTNTQDNQNKDKENQEKERREKERKGSSSGVNCLEWDRNVNYFVEDFGEVNANDKALEFEEWFKKKYRTFFDNRSIDFNTCKQDEAGNDIGISYYKVKEIYYMCPFIREISQMKDGTGEKIYDKWKFTLQESKIRKKLIEYKKMKTIKESIREKVLLKKEEKDKKVNKISENLYKIAGDFYNERYEIFFEKFVRLNESYKKSKLFLMEGSSEDFSSALIRVFKGDEDKLVDEAIPWFVNKLGLDGAIKTQVEEKLRDKYSDSSEIAGLFNDDWSDIVVQAVKDNAKSNIGEPTNVMDAVEKVMISKLDTSDFDYQLKKLISNMISPSQDEKKEKIKNLADQIKNSILNSEI